MGHTMIAKLNVKIAGIITVMAIIHQVTGICQELG